MLNNIRDSRNVATTGKRFAMMRNGLFTQFGGERQKPVAKLQLFI